MKVKQLIKELKEFPQNCIVGVSNHDNYDSEVASVVGGVDFLKKEDNCTTLPDGTKVKFPDCDCVVNRC